MTTLQDELDRRALNDALLVATTDLSGIVGLGLSSMTAADIWVDDPAVCDTVRARCAAHPLLTTLALTFREVPADADSPGNSADRPRTRETTDEHSDTTGPDHDTSTKVDL